MAAGGGVSLGTCVGLAKVGVRMGGEVHANANVAQMSNKKSRLII